MMQSNHGQARVAERFGSFGPICVRLVAVGAAHFPCLILRRAVGERKLQNEKIFLGGFLVRAGVGVVAADECDLEFFLTILGFWKLRVNEICDFLKFFLIFDLRIDKNLNVSKVFTLETEIFVLLKIAKIFFYIESEWRIACD